MGVGGPDGGRLSRARGAAARPAPGLVHGGGIAKNRGPVWVKANARAFAAEAGLLLLLAEHVPERVLHPIACHPAQGWFITPDGGQVLEASGPVTQANWVEMLTGYADL